MSGELFLKSGDVVKDLSTGMNYLCLATSEDQALIAPSELNEDGEWSFYMKDQMFISNKAVDYSLEIFEFIRRK